MKKASNLCSRKFWYIPKFQADQFQQMTGCPLKTVQRHSRLIFILISLWSMIDP